MKHESWWCCHYRVIVKAFDHGLIASLFWIPPNTLPLAECRPGPGHGMRGLRTAYTLSSKIVFAKDPAEKGHIRVQSQHFYYFCFQRSRLLSLDHSCHGFQIKVKMNLLICSKVYNYNHRSFVPTIVKFLLFWYLILRNVLGVKTKI